AQTDSPASAETAASAPTGAPARFRPPPPPAAPSAPRDRNRRADRPAPKRSRRPAPNTAAPYRLMRSSSSWSLLRDHQFLARLNAVGTLQTVAVRFEDLHVLVRAAVELFADLRQRVARLHRVS